MQKKVTLALFTLLIVVLGMVLLNLLNDESGSIHIEAEYLSPSQKKSEEVLKSRTWSEALASSKDSKFSFPVNELYMQIDLKKYIPPKVKSYRLVVDRTDRYSLFCIVQTLSQMNLPYVVEKRDRVPIIYVGSKTENSLKNVVQKLKDYDIESKIVEVWL
jgi:hypothetical protein